MQPQDIIFDENLMLSDVKIAEQQEPFFLALSDDLNLAEEIISNNFKNKIITFINNSSKWFEIAKNKIFTDTGNTEGLQLVTLHILSEQSADYIIFGLEFSLAFDREHGRGLQINAETYEIIDYGTADISFSL